MAQRPRFLKARSYCKKAVSACSAIFGLAIVRALTFFIDKARVWRFELTYKLHLKVRSVHDNLVVKNVIYRKVTENKYAVPVRNATASAFVVSLMLFTTIQYILPQFNLLAPGQVYAGSNNKTWTTKADFETAATNAGVTIGGDNDANDANNNDNTKLQATSNWSQPSNPTAGTDTTYSTAVDGEFVYIGGLQYVGQAPDLINGDYQWRIEKRNISDGTLVWAQTENNGGYYDYVKDIFVSGSSLYLVGIGSGASNNDTKWVIEKRNISDGGLAWTRTYNPSTGNDVPMSGATDGSWIYVGGLDNSMSNNPAWRLEKISSVDGSLSTAVTVDISTGVTSYESITGVAVSGGYVYIGGYGGSASNSFGRIQKRNSSNLALTIGTWTVDSDPTTGNDGIQDLIIDGSFLYVGGYSGANYRYEKRNMTTGALVYGQNITPTGTNPNVNMMTSDGTYFYTSASSIGTFPTYYYIIEKRLLSDASLVWTITGKPCRGITFSNSSLFTAVTNTGGGGDWLTERMSDANGSVTAFNTPGNLGSSVTSAVGLRYDSGIGNTAKASTISLTGTTASNNQKVKLKVRSGDTQGELDTSFCYGPTSTGSGCSDWSTAGSFFYQQRVAGVETSSTTGILNTIPAKRFIEVLVRLESDGSNTPVLDRVDLGYNYLDAPIAQLAKRLSGTTDIPYDTYTNESGFVEKYFAQGFNSGETLYPEIEVVSQGASFTGTGTVGPGVLLTPGNYANPVELAVTKNGLAPGNYKFKVRTSDSTGRISAWSTNEVLFRIEQELPTGSVTIGGSNVTGGYAKSRNVVLSSTVNDTGGSGLGQMQFANKPAIDGDPLVWSGWEPYSTSRVWALSAGNGAKTVYAQYRDNAGNVTNTWAQTSQADFQGGQTSGNASVTNTPGTIKLVGGVQTTIIRPNGPGNYSQWSQNPATGQNWDKVDEVVNNQGDYVLGGGKDLYNLQDPALSNVTITGVNIYADAFGSDDCGGCSSLISFGIYDGSGEWFSTGVENSGSPLGNFGSLTNPRTGLAWTLSQINSLQIGLLSSGSSAILYQIYAEVSYIPSSLSGNFASFVKDNASAQHFENISWSADVPTQAGADALRFQVAANNDNTTWNYVGPDGTSGTYFTTSGTQIPTSLNGNQYIRYKAYLQSADSAYTPVIYDVSIGVTTGISAAVTLDATAPTGTATINAGNPTYATNRAVTMILDASDVGTGLKDFQLSNDGVTWGAATDANGAITNSGWQTWDEAYKTTGYSGSWSLLAGLDGPRKVYARFRDLALNIGGDYYPNWIDGTGTINNIQVYNANEATKKQWGPVSACPGPQCTTVTDAYWGDGNGLSADNSLDYSAYPARAACQIVGGRLPTFGELEGMYANQSSYGQAFNQDDFFWTSMEYDLNSSNARGFKFSNEASSATPKNYSYYVRCVRDLTPAVIAISDNVTLDMTLPTTALIADPVTNDGSNGWYKTNPTITLTATKNGSGVGIENVLYRWDNSDLGSGTTTYSTPFDMAGSIGQGTHTLYYRSKDFAGHVEGTQQQLFKLDTTLPTTGYSIGTPNGANGWFVDTAPQITLSPSDAGGGSASGIASTKYQWDSTSGNWTTGTSVTAITGDHVLYYYSTDTAGNDEVQIEHQQIKFDNGKPLTPTDFRAPLNESSTNIIVLHWDAALDGGGSGAVDYQIRRKKDSILSWNDASVWTSGQLGNVQVYSDNAGLDAGFKYNYQIRATDLAGNLADWPGDGVKTDGYTIDNVPPSTPSAVVATVCDGTVQKCSDVNNRGSEIRLTWTISNDTGLGMGPDAEGKIGHYKIWRSVTGSGVENEWVLVGVVDGSSGQQTIWYDNNDNNAATYNIGVYPVTDQRSGQPAGKTSISTGLNDYTQYYYRITALDLINNESDLFPPFFPDPDINKNGNTAITPDITPPTNPSAVTATALGLDGSDLNNPNIGHQRISVNWAASVDCKALVTNCTQATPNIDRGSGNVSYKVYRSTTNYLDEADWLTSGTLVTTTAAETYEDNGLADTTTYYYRVIAMDASTNTSGFSSVDPNSSARTYNSDVPSAPIEVQVSSLKGDTTADASVGHKITVNFKGSNSKGDQIVRYEVYRYKNDTNNLTAAEWLDPTKTTKLKLSSAGGCGSGCLAFTAGSTGSDISITPNQADRDNQYQIVDTGLVDGATYFYRVRAQDNANVPNQPDQSNRFGPLSSITSLNSGGANKFGWDITPDATAPTWSLTPTVQSGPAKLRIKDINGDGVFYLRNIVTWERIPTSYRGIANDFREYKIYRSMDGVVWDQIKVSGNNPLYDADQNKAMANNFYIDYISEVEALATKNAGRTYRYAVTALDDAAENFRYADNTPVNGVNGTFYSNETKIDKLASSVDLNPIVATPHIETVVAQKLPRFADVGVSEATITWYTDQRTDSVVEYRKATPDAAISGDDKWVTVGDRAQKDPTEMHSVKLIALKPTTQYYYRIISRNFLGNEAMLASDPGNDNYSTVLPGLTTSGFTITPGNTVSTTSTTEVTWSTNLDASSAFVEYQLQRHGGDEPQGGTAGVDPEALSASPRNHRVIIKGLRSDRTYTYKVKSISKDGYLAEYPAGEFANFKTKAFDSAQFTLAPASSNVAERNITATTAQIVWQTGNETTSWVDYSTTSGVYDVSAGNNNMATTHVVVIEGLIPGTKYYYRVRVKDANEVEYTSQEYSFTAVLKPKISNMTVKNITPYSVTIAWETNVDTETIVNWGTSTAYGEKRGKNGVSKVHELVIDNLIDNQEYHYQILAKDEAGNEVADTDKLVRTPLDTEGPKITNAKTDILPMGENDTTASVIISWNTNKPASTLVEYDEGIIGGNYANRSVEDTSLNTSHTVIVKNLKPASSFHYRMVSADKRNNITQSQDYTFVTPTKEKSILQLILKSLEDTFAWTKNLNQFFGNVGKRITGQK